ncbi:hypothetical protein [Paenibacillus sp. FSL H3-0469]|uniref:hypothetical protein n=1 Tax=Paenibacillus sp. FSL H3-0469 TaxID=2954506 RepID=UPI003100DF5F
MKSVLILGVGRAGKTTLAGMLKAKLPEFNLSHSDDLKWAMIRGEGREGYFRNNIKEQKEFEHSDYFQRFLLEFFISGSKTNKCILESGQLHPKYVRDYIHCDEHVVVCLGHGSLDQQGIIDLCRTNDKATDWSYGLSHSDLEQHAGHWAKMNYVLHDDCLKYGIPYIDTSQYRNKVLEETLEYVSNRVAG